MSAEEIEDDNLDNVFSELSESLSKVENLFTAFHQGEDDPVVLQELVDYVFDLNLIWNNGCTPLMEAVLTENPCAVQILINGGADVNMYSQVRETDDYGRVRKRRETPLIAASRCGFLEVVKVLIKNGCNLNLEPGDCRMTALHYSCNRGFLDITKLLVESGADINHSGDYRFSPLLEAAMENQLDTVIYLVENGADLKAKIEESCETALFVAMILNHREVAKYLIQAGSDVNDINFTGMDVLAFSIAEGHSDLCFMLMLAGSSVQVEHIQKLSRSSYFDSSFVDLVQDKGRTPQPLLQQCRIKLRHALMLCTGGTSILPRIAQLPLPPRLVDYLKLDIL